jgi:methyl-accepting chemotaxis protein
MKSAIDKITLSTDNVLHKFEDIDTRIKTVAEQEDDIRRSMEEQGEGSKQVLQAVGLVSEMTNQVKAEATEMLEGSREVIQEAANLEKATQEMTLGMNEMAAGADEINVAVNKVNDLTVKNRDSIDHLVHEVSRFRVE